MSHLEWVIVIVGGAIVLAVVIAASENEKRLDRIIALLDRDDEKLPKAFWGIAQTLQDIKYRLPEPKD